MTKHTFPGHHRGHRQRPRQPQQPHVTDEQQAELAWQEGVHDAIHEHDHDYDDGPMQGGGSDEITAADIANADAEYAAFVQLADQDAAAADGRDDYQEEREP